MNLKKSFLVLSILSLNLFNAKTKKKPLVSAITEKDLKTDMVIYLTIHISYILVETQKGQ